MKKVPQGMIKWPGWRAVLKEYKNHIPSYHQMQQYLVRRMFKALYGREHRTMYEFFINRHAPMMPFTGVLTEAICAFKKGSFEKRILQAILHSSYTLGELETMVTENPRLFEDYDSNNAPVEVRRPPVRELPRNAFRRGMSDGGNVTGLEDKEEREMGGAPRALQHGPDKSGVFRNGNLQLSKDDELMDDEEEDGNVHTDIQEEVAERIRSDTLRSTGHNDGSETVTNVITADEDNEAHSHERKGHAVRSVRRRLYMVDSDEEEEMEEQYRTVGREEHERENERCGTGINGHMGNSPTGTSSQAITENDRPLSEELCQNGVNEEGSQYILDIGGKDSYVVQ